MTFNPRANFSQIAQRSIIENFCPQLSAILTTSGSSQSITFTPLTGQGCQTFCIANTGSNAAYIGWGHTTATAVASTGTPAANCHCIPAGAVETLDFQLSTGVVDTVAAIQSTGGSTTLEISLGFGA